MLMMPYHLPYQGRLVEACGFTKAKDLLAYTVDKATYHAVGSNRMLDKMQSDGRIRLRALDMKNYKPDLAALLQVFNDAWSENWEMVPFAQPEIEAAAASMKPLIDPDMVVIAEIDNEVAGMLVCLPNLMEAVRDLDGGLLPFGFAKLLWRLKRKTLKTARVPADGHPQEVSRHPDRRGPAAADVPPPERPVLRARPGAGRTRLDPRRQPADAPRARRHRRQGLQDLPRLPEGDRVNALILAGSRGPDDPMAKAANVSHKALLPVAGVPMLLRVVEALRAMPGIARIYVCIENERVVLQVPALEALHRDRALEILPAADSPATSVAAALRHIELTQPLLVTTGDHPLLTPAILQRFVDTAPKDCDLAVALAPADIVAAAYPGAIRTFYRLGKQRFSGCNLFLVRSSNVARVANFWRRMETHRKRPLRLIWEIGPLAPRSGFCWA